MEQDVKKVGVAWEKTFQDSDSKKFNISISDKELQKLPSDDNGKTSLALIKRDTPDEKTGITHDVVQNKYTPGQPKNESEDLVFEINKKEAAKIPLRNDNVTLEAVMKKNVERDRANYHVRELTENKEKTYVGRGWTPSQTMNIEYVGTAWKKEFENGKMYNVSVKAETFDALPENKYGQVNLSLMPKKDSDNQLAVYKSMGKDPYSEFTISVKKQDVMAMGPNSAGYYPLIVTDKAKISKDKADLLVMENPYEKNKKTAEETGVSIKEAAAQRPVNYVGSGWSNRPEHIRLSEDDKSAKGLSAAIANNHTMKVAAILKEGNFANQTHNKLIAEMKESDKPIDKEMERLVSSSIQNSKGVKI